MIAALFVRRDSHYKAVPDVDAYDFERDALTWPGGVPAIFHPPCRSWGRYKAVAKPRDGERELALWSVAMCRRFGGVVEHPVSSGLWSAVGCLTPGIRDAYGGLLITLNQGDYGHRAPKPTALYLVGCDVPATPFDLADCSGRIESMGRAERERTPVPFMDLLVELARSVRLAA